jgi:hypothetical protein
MKISKCVTFTMTLADAHAAAAERRDAGKLTYPMQPSGSAHLQACSHGGTYSRADTPTRVQRCVAVRHSVACACMKVYTVACVCMNDA